MYEGNREDEQRERETERKEKNGETVETEEQGMIKRRDRTHA